MRYIIPAIALLLWSCSHVTPPASPFELGKTFTYEEGMQWWSQFSEAHSNVSLLEYGMTDAGYPLNLAVLSKHERTLDQVRASNKSVILINNAIHPGEPDGVKASMMLYHQLISEDLPKNVILVCIPFYNIGGTLNISSDSRANQNGPQQYGFRGNAQNLDLNRDFVKCDSRNAMSFAKLIQDLDPEIYLETHVSNGADYQYTLTYLSTQEDKLSPSQSQLMRNDLIPFLKDQMKDKHEIVPYVNVHGTALIDHYNTFYDSPRYSTGLTTLHNCLGIITESHMLKPYDDRVDATFHFLHSVVSYAEDNSDPIQHAKIEANQWVIDQNELALDWELDSSRVDSFLFKGYQASYVPSAIGKHMRLFYDRNEKTQVKMKYYGYMKPSVVRSKPLAYVLRQGYVDVVERLEANGVELIALDKDSTLRLVSYLISKYETNPQPYEKHYYHYNTQFVRDSIEITLNKGDLIIPMGTSKDRLVVELLEPDGPDSYFNWNFFDAILQQKEWYSSYVFEDKAAEYLANDPELKKAFETKKANEADFASSSFAQLYWIYQHSPHYEKEHMRMPVFRIE